MQPYGPNGLPNDVPTQYFVQGVPHRPPFVPQIPVRPQVHEFLPAVTGHVIYEIQRFANTDLAWKSLFWKAAQNTFQNPFFCDIISFAMEYLEFILFVQRAHPQQAIPGISIEMASIFAGMEAASNPGIRHNLTPEQNSTHDSWLRAFNEKKPHIAAYINANPVQQNGYGYNQQQQGYGGYGNGGGGGGRGAGSVHHAVGANGYSGPGPAYTPGYGPQGGYPGGHQQQQQRPNNVAPTRSSLNNDNPLFRQFERPPPQEGADNKQRSETANRKEHVIEEFHMDNTVQLPSAVKELSYNSKKNLTPSSRGSYFTLYNPLYEVSYIEVNDKAIIETVEKREPNVEYKDHETEHFFRVRAQAEKNDERDFRTAQAAFKGVLATKNVEARLAEHEKYLASIETTSDEMIYFTEPVIVDDVINLHANHDPFEELKSLLIKTPIDVEESIINFTVQRIKFGLLEGQDAVLAASLSQSRDFKVLHQRVMELCGNIHPQIKNELLDTLTTAVNELLQITLNLPIKIGTFADDVPELQEYIATEFGSLFAEKFNENCFWLAQTYCSVVDNATEAYKTVYSDPDDTYRCAFGWLENYVRLPIHSRDLIIQHSGKAGLVPKSGRYEDFYKAVDAIFGRQSKPVRHTKLVFNDGEMVDLYRAGIGAGFLVRNPNK